ncbi:hypothetical protein PtrSN002B_000724 [Pyrenophora tritici-repentis]|uniref:Atrophin-1 domain containing protein n=2 Tax=Pyrenophora tritici-repentis TaxID=45151 RepID=A0A2W1I264_9PLEO|nr:uncharacterized protein PTRG_03046 [Pyrenophora tritici-repentis Pt-1C-BFP]KAA8622871.1 hypothetical protein PtrV1_04177 [Pyrenophora tritici-repentis]EDU45569.1 predicted protein [Pyrenophora tritici-repentis Pt-1C-BFP]KAF7451862.1 hypothetical protein A1F99_036390 [Pyrenophora tritici-repentis]KAF7575015.1 Atrophin-1 domain containing protein [Pyrenophora tritici-repentis]KAG9386220.1 hypothetical protein A1F94_002970 [Pyrenophora tritici-repentis]
MSNNTTALTPLSLEEVLHIYLLCFETAADTIPEEPVAYTVPYRHLSVPVPIWQLWTRKVVKDKGPPKNCKRIPKLPVRLQEALARKDLCGYFCWLLEREVNEKIAERFGGSALWVLFKPKINFLLAFRDCRNQPNIPLHSVLLIETPGKETMIMDGTLRQYLWAPSTWLQTMGEWEDRRVDKSNGGRGFQRNPSYCKKDVEQSARKNDKGYWKVVRERMTKLLKDMNWDELESLETGKRIELVREMAREKFAGVWEDACDPHQRHSNEHR